MLGRYARIAGNNVINGAMAVNWQGNAVLSFSVVGPDYNYSAGYMVIKANCALPDSLHIHSCSLTIVSPHNHQRISIIKSQDERADCQ